MRPAVSAVASSDKQTPAHETAAAAKRGRERDVIQPHDTQHGRRKQGARRPHLATAGHPGPESDVAGRGGPRSIIHAPAWGLPLKRRGRLLSRALHGEEEEGRTRSGWKQEEATATTGSSSSSLLRREPRGRSRRSAARCEVSDSELGMGVEEEDMEREAAIGEEEVACECCGFTEECTAPYIAGVRARYGGRWICGLCGDAVGEELGRASPPISPAEALDRHACVCRRVSAPPSPAGSPDDLIAALRLLLRRRLGSSPPPPPRRVRSTPSSPRRDPLPIASSPVLPAGPAVGPASSLARTGSCFAALVE